MAAKELALKYFIKYTPTVFDSEPGSRLPAAYRKFYDEWRNTPPKPVHYIPHTGSIWFRNEETGEVKRRENVPLPLRHPKEFNDVFTGGECIVQGFLKNKKYACRVPKFWVPKVYRSVVYSEILDKYLSTLITNRVIDLIHESQGFDKYILETKACDLRTTIALKVKRILLTALHNKNLPYDEEKNKAIYEKYKKYLIPPEEIEWYGLTFTDALKKLNEIEEAEKLAEIVPLKHVFRTQLIEELKQENTTSTTKLQEEVEQKSVTKKLLDNIPGFLKKR